MIVQVMAILNLVLTQQIYSEETNGAHAHYREPVPLKNLQNTKYPNKFRCMLLRIQPQKKRHINIETFTMPSTTDREKNTTMVKTFLIDIVRQRRAHNPESPKCSLMLF